MSFTADTTLPESVFSLPQDCSEKLNEIIIRHRNYMVAKANGSLATSSCTLKALGRKARRLNTSSEEKEAQCAFCLEEMVAGEDVIELPCGHIFHAGEKPLEVKHRSCGSKRKLKELSCRGLMYWLKSNSSCPVCRFEFPTELPSPSESESLLIPLLHRQNRLIARQIEIIRAQKKQISELSKKQKMQARPLMDERCENERRVSVGRSLMMEEGKRVVAEFKLPRLSWQNSTCPLQKRMRQKVLEKVTDVALRDIIVRGAMDERSKTERLQELAAKIEFILYCCSTSFAEYSSLATLRHRTLHTVKNLADRARALKAEQATAAIIRNSS